MQANTPDSFGLVGPKALLIDRLSKKTDLQSVTESLSVHTEGHSDACKFTALGAQVIHSFYTYLLRPKYVLASVIGV